MLEQIPTLLATYGFDRYEISNYAKPGYESIHNQVYWKGGDYLGVGAGAHSYCAEYDQAGVIQKAERWSTLALPQSYIAATQNEATVSWRESLDRAALMFEFFYLGLRMTQGVSQSQFASRFGESIPELYTSPIRELVSEGFLVYRDNNALALTQAGVAVADSVFERLSTPSLRLGAP
jgi:oxygen-independent coproporphyrinogen-3 oxidase